MSSIRSTKGRKNLNQKKEKESKEKKRDPVYQDLLRESAHVLMERKQGEERPPSARAAEALMVMGQTLRREIWKGREAIHKALLPTLLKKKKGKVPFELHSQRAQQIL